MKVVMLIAGAILFSASINIFAKDLPTSAEQLRSELESALKNKNASAFIELFNWDGIQEKSFVRMAMKLAINQNTNDVISVTLSPLPANYHATNEMFSLRTRDNVITTGMIDVKRSGEDFVEHLPYGTKGGAFYLAQTIREMIPGKSLRVTVSIFDPHPIITYTGTCVYVQEGKEINLELCGTNKYIEKNLWGDYIKSCSIQKTSPSGLIMLEIVEGHQKIFQSPQIKTGDVISYERKN